MRSPRSDISTPDAFMSSPRPPTPMPSVSRPPEISFTVSACLAVCTAFLRSGPSITEVSSPISLVTAAAAASAASGS